MAGRWIMYDNGAWDFKIDNDRMGSAVDCSSIKGVCRLKDSILDAYGLLGREIEVEMCYWLIDGESEMLGKGAAPVEIATDTDYKIFKALHRTDKSFIVFVTFREIVGGEMIFLRSERDIFTQTNATAIIVDDDENLIRQVEANEAAIGLNFEATEVGGSKDSRAAADGVCGVNLEAENIRQQSCVEQILVQRRKNKQANVEAASGDDIGNVAGCAVMDVDKRKGNDYDNGEEEDDSDYDYNYWHEFVRKDCDTDKMTISKDVHQKDGVVDGLIETVMNVLDGWVVEVKDMENRRLVEANDQGLLVDLHLEKIKAI
ncbi:hypothetical protein Bca4012_029159 [Brassica carinata]